MERGGGDLKQLLVISRAVKLCQENAALSFLLSRPPLFFMDL